MKGGNVSDFIDQTTFEECAVMYKGVKYFFHGLMFDKAKNEYSYMIDVWDNDNNYIKTVFSKTSPTSENVWSLRKMNRFLMVKHFGLPRPIWNGLNGKVLILKDKITGVSNV